MTSHQKRVLSFFDSEFARFILPDLERLSDIRPDSQGLRACSIPQAMLVFAVLDLLGYLINPDVNASKQNTLENYRAVFSSRLGLFPQEYEDETDRIVKLFRHGIMHQFFPKASAIGKGHGERQIIFESGRIPCLNLDRFTRDATDAIGELRTRIANGQHDALALQMNDRLDVMNREDFEALAKLR
jgi:hypothetical protein